MLDGAYLLCIKQEIGRYIGGRIDKIHQPSREEIVISLRSAQGDPKILISSSGTAGRIHITGVRIENPQSPPMFCMLLRKRLSGAKLIDVRQTGLERILFMEFETRNELGDIVKLTLAAEVMGKYSNLILMDEDGKIIDSIRRIDDIEGERLILPGVHYTMPARRERLNFLTAQREDMVEHISQFKGPSLAKGLIGIFEGLSPVIFREWIFRVTGQTDMSSDEFTEDTADKITDEIERTRDRFLSGDRSYIVLCDKDDIPRDICFENITQYNGIYKTVRCATAGEALDMFWSERDRLVRLKQRYQDLYKTVKSIHERILRRTEIRRRELEDTLDRDKYRRYGDLISANLYKLEKGMTELVCEDFYEESMPTVTVKLDARYTPSQNMQRMYQAYRKADTANKRLTALIEEGDRETAYIESVRDLLERAERAEDIAELREELAAQGYIKQSGRKSSKQKQRPLEPMVYTSPAGFTVLVGRNNRQNDELTKSADKNDMWLHTKDIPGSHVIIRAEGKQIDDETILFASQLAAYHSSARGSDRVPVDHTLVRYVKKPNGAKPGMVIFTNNKTLYVKPKL
ncbi:MAG: NFACT family protein [Oscillospiraceae bacterium]|nr:NFACT family protein [Oscillospiraceae bacterium]